MIGLLIGVAYGLVTRSWNSPFGFGPAIALGAILAILVPHDFSSLPWRSPSILRNSESTNRPLASTVRKSANRADPVSRDA